MISAEDLYPLTQRKKKGDKKDEARLRKIFDVGGTRLEIARPLPLTNSAAQILIREAASLPLTPGPYSPHLPDPARRRRGAVLVQTS